jgi:hypothetical protein
MPLTALVASAHGLGHLTRLLSIGQQLQARGHRCLVFAQAPSGLIENSLPGALHLPWQADVGLVQAHSLHEDIEATALAFEERCSESRIDALARALEGVDQVVVDSAPAALEAARRAGRPAALVGSFTWPWIYRHYRPLWAAAERMEGWQEGCRALELWPGPGLAGLQAEPMGLVARPGRPWSPGHPYGLVSFGGLGLPEVEALLPEIPGLTWVCAHPMPPLVRPDAACVAGVPYPDLVAGAELVVTKPGYGILAECLQAGTPIAWLPRGSFPEAPSLEAVMRARGDQALPGGPGTAEALGRALQLLRGRERPAPVPALGAARVAQALSDPAPACR